MKTKLPLSMRFLRVLLAGLLVVAGMMPLAPHAMAAPGADAEAASGLHSGMMHAGLAVEDGAEASDCEGHDGSGAGASPVMDQCCPSACFAVFIGSDPRADDLPVLRGRLETKLLRGLVVAAPPAFERPPRA